MSQREYRGSSSFYPATARYSTNCMMYTVQYILFLPSHCQVKYKLYDVHCTVHRPSTQPMPGTVKTVYFTLDSTPSFYPATARYSTNCMMYTVQYILFLPSHCQVQYKLYDVHCTVRRPSTQPMPGTVQTVCCTLDSTPSFYPANARHSTNCLLYTGQYTVLLPSQFQAHYKLFAVHWTVHRPSAQPLTGTVQTLYCTLYPLPTMICLSIG